MSRFQRQCTMSEVSNHCNFNDKNKKQICQSAIQNCKQLKKHNKKYHQPNKYDCYSCTEVFKNKSDIKNHIYYSHRSKNKNMYPSATIDYQISELVKVYKIVKMSGHFRIIKYLSTVMFRTSNVNVPAIRIAKTLKNSVKIVQFQKYKKCMILLKYQRTHKISIQIDREKLAKNSNKKSFLRRICGIENQLIPLKN